MGKIKVTVLVLLVLLLLSGCKREDVSLVYGDAAFECEVSFERGGEHFRAALVAASPSVEGERDVSVRFLEPSAMSGICVVRERGEVRCELDGTVMYGVAFSEWLDVVRLFETDGEISFVAVENIRAEETDHLRLARADGETLDIHISRRDGLPVRISGYGLVADIIYFDTGE